MHSSSSSHSSRRPSLSVTTRGSQREEEEKSIPLEHPTVKGFLSKKRKFGWLERYFILEKGVFSYYNSPHDTFPLGFVSLKEIVDIRLVPNKNSGRRFEVELYQKTMILCAETKEKSIEWVTALRDSKDIDIRSSRKSGGANQPRTPRTPTFVGMCRLSCLYFIVS